ncbi:MAG TPA: efflux RND transporter periplasmic adaptor subunit [Deltaproteobacteria bacterium]|nr:efflux RND transporter periplasmic adaptor subunit [Deltaproteobacteria bacterium]
MRSFYKLLIIIVIIAVGIVIARGLIMTKPEAKRRPVSIAAPLVEYALVVPQSKRITIDTTGTVIPAKEVSLQSQVSGKVVWVNEKLVPGALVSVDDVLVRVDPRDYELAVAQQKVSLTKAQVEYETEQGRAEVARREWELLKGDVEYTESGRDLALRKPQLENARAGIEAARSALKKAELDLERTVIHAPFNAVIMTENVDVGQLISPGVAIATLAGSDSFRVQASVNIDELAWIDIPGVNAEKGSRARIIQLFGGKRNNHTGEVEQLLSEVDEKGRMARVLINVPDPFEGSREMPLLLGAYVSAHIEGKSLDDIYVIPNEALREGEKVWLLTKENTLAIKGIQVVWRQREEVFVQGLSPQDRLITSRISVPVEGMDLRTNGNGDSPQRSGEK